MKDFYDEVDDYDRMKEEGRVSTFLIAHCEGHYERKICVMCCSPFVGIVKGRSRGKHPNGCRPSKACTCSPKCSRRYDRVQDSIKLKRYNRLKRSII